MNHRQLREVLERAGVVFGPGLSSSELKTVERHFRFRFPPDLRDFLAFALPVSPGFPNWRRVDDPHLEAALAWPLEGMIFDIEHNAFWPTEWGTRPDALEAASDVARQEVANAPRLIPVHGHRYLPDRPYCPGNPVFSVYQTDIIYYGTDLENFLHNEFHFHFGTPEYSLPGRIRRIEFWSWLADLNG